ncbi:DEAD/DEAH box helicase [Moraxella sp. Tifton1]|uniref:DEAD/DEAH box helicase n=1 Tax=Moraxella oculi TaxID=2940516 RepID=UPI0020119D72|nr:DEAD/DEAH box helicase [Moraxella sp. Tifton1]MCL1623494.1 DEAD/DEAH box helicase [Moraxella sp. Tifton1]
MMTSQHASTNTPHPDDTASQISLATASFDELQLNTPILKALKKSGYTTPTPIQAGAIPHALSGRDLLLSAQTGSGKTAAFVLPILDKLSRLGRLDKHIHALILTPTRELAQQVHDSVRRYGGNLRGLYSIPLVGGAPYGGQIRALRKGVQIVIATPGRLIDHMNEGRADLSKLDVLVLDEADRMLDMGFAEDIKTILQQAPQTRQTVMSSATWDGAVGKIAESFTNNPQKISIKVESAHIEESVYFCDDFHHKNRILLELLSDDAINQAVIFTATKRSTEQLTETLTQAGLKARYLHGDLPQGKRNRIINDVKSGKCDFLIATDVAARGIDISAISHVVNYDLPRQVEDYVHRIGRCGRAGRTGVAMNLCSFDDRGQLRNINRYLKRTMNEAVIEGLEPKRPPFEQEVCRKKKGRGSYERRRGGYREFGLMKHDKQRGEHDTDRRKEHAAERSYDRHQDLKRAKFGKKTYHGERHFDRNKRTFDRHEYRFDDEGGQYRHAHRDVIAQEAFSRTDRCESQQFKRQGRHGKVGRERVSEHKHAKESFSRGKFRPKKPKTVEQVFFTQKQTKKRFD